MPKQSTNLCEGEAPPTNDLFIVGGTASDHGGRSTVPSLSSQVAVISSDRWAVRPQTWLNANTAVKPGRYSDVIGPFD